MDGPIELELFHGGRWWKAGSAELRRGLVRTDPTWLSYSPDYVADRLSARDVRALSWRFPIDYELHELPTFPAFLCDVIPQGEARRALEAQLRTLGEPTSDWSLLQHGARHPVGNLRVAHSPASTPVSPGFSREDVIERGDAFHDWAEREGVPMTGSSDTGGASPKLLLTEDHQGRLHADGALPDAHAARHFLVKFARGRRRADAQVLAHEPAYLELARRAGARCAAPLVHDRGTLFVPRFDRIVADGEVRRAGLESMYALTGVVEPGARLVWEDVLPLFAEATDDPRETLIELVRRDALALALGDTDNHGRNTSIIKMPDGRVTLSPLYDFAPMYLDPELIKRSTTWRSEKPGDPPEWADVANGLSRWIERADVCAAMREIGVKLEQLTASMRDLGVDGEIIGFREKFIALVSRSLQAVV